MFGDCPSCGAQPCSLGLHIGVTAGEPMTESTADILQPYIAAGSRFLGTWDWSICLDLVTVSPMVASVFSIEPDRALEGIPSGEFLSRVHAEDRPELESRIEQTIKTGGELLAHYRVLRSVGPPAGIISRGYCDIKVGSFTGGIAIVGITDPAELDSNHAASHPPALAKRERECLYWCSRGKTNWEIGQILSISERTAEHHIASAARKLGSTSRVHAVAQAIRKRLIV